MDVRTVNALAAAGYTGTYQIVDAIDTSGPVLTITVTGHDKATVEHTLRGVTDMIDSKLSSLQTGLNSVNTIRDLVISFAPKATSASGKKVRSLSIVVGVGLVLTLGITMIVDATIIRRRMQPARPKRKRGRDQEVRGSHHDNTDEPDFRHEMDWPANAGNEPHADVKSQAGETRPQPIPERTFRRR